VEYGSKRCRRPATSCSCVTCRNQTRIYPETLEPIPAGHSSLASLLKVAAMKLPKPSENATWIVLGALLLLARKRTRKPRGPGRTATSPVPQDSGALPFSSSVNSRPPSKWRTLTRLQRSPWRSGGRPKAVGDKEPHRLWQINVYTCPKRFATSEVSKTLDSCRSHVGDVERGTNWEPWSTFRSGPIASTCQKDSRGILIRQRPGVHRALELTMEL